MQQGIKKVTVQDVGALKKVIDSSGLFPPDLLDGMIYDYFNKASSADIWLTKVKDGRPVSIAYCAPERMTQGTYNLYLIAVDKAYQGQGIGGEMMQYIEDLLRKDGQRILIVETSGLPEYSLTRKFYHKCNYIKEAVLRDFYREGEDKVIFWKRLQK